ncbi:hypothetical protein AB0A95_15955 [Micromonospora sp. NPDC049230]|uniref:hypothetical protein n=1 Tax=Micromonospora sp. NPDC049230 TaxID=3155502 RepID=UPI0033FB3B12
MRLLLTVTDHTTSATDYQVEAALDSTVAELAEALAERRPDSDTRPPTVFVAGAPLDPGLTLADAPLWQGSVLELDRPAPESPPRPPGPLEIRVVSGLGAGGLHQLDIGEHTIGAADDNDVRLTDASLAPVIARVRVTEDGECWLRPAEPGLLLDRVEIEDEQVWAPGAQLAAGSSLLELRRPVGEEAALQISEDRTGLDYNRPPRLLPPARTTQFTLPGPPTPPERRPLTLITVLAPVVLSGAAFLITRNPLTLLFAILSPLVLIAGQVGARRQGRATYRSRLAEYEKKS